MKNEKNSNQVKGECTVIGRAKFVNGKIAYPDSKPKSIFDGLF